MSSDRQEADGLALPRPVAQWMREDIEKWRGEYRTIAFMAVAWGVGIVVQLVQVVLEVLK